MLYIFSTSEGGLPKDPLKEDCGLDVAQGSGIVIKVNPPTINVVGDAFSFLVFDVRVGGWLPYDAGSFVLFFSTGFFVVIILVVCRLSCSYLALFFLEKHVNTKSGQIESGPPRSFRTGFLST